jgi:hypothetical protein
MTRIACLLAAALISLAAAPPPGEPIPNDYPLPSLIEELTKIARSRLPMAMIEDGSKVPPETPEELAKPIISRALETEIVLRGRLASKMDHCGLDSDSLSYLPMMKALRARGWRGKRMAYIGVLHGTSMGEMDLELKDAPACTAAEVESLKQEAAAKFDLPAE